MIVEIWAVKRSRDFTRGVIYDEVRKTQRPLMVLGFNADDEELADCEFRELVINCGPWAKEELDLGEIDKFLEEVSMKWDKLARRYRCVKFSMWFDVPWNNCLPEEISDGETYLQSGWQDFRVWLIQRLLDQFDTQVPGFAYPDIKYQNH